MDWRKTAKILTIVVSVATALTALYIMVGGLGLQDSLDFGAGAYFYADIPEFEKYTEGTIYHTALPYWVFVVLFVAWGALMYKLWKKLDK